MVNPRKKPKFLRQGAKFLKRLGEKWRKPRGSQSKVRKRKKGKAKMPEVGYRAPKELRGLHPSGLREVLVRNLKDVEKVNPKEEVIRIASSVGKKLKEKILKRAEELKIRVLNP